ncbi:hypothetical protein DENSPDRAFT_882788 [Dentipellis sp. KUC8613]|nr:hypothetical protein DENSPDRAFT_882788 [Dentipellis sp. KUC8613]
MRNKTPSVKVIMTSVASILLTLATGHMIIDVVRALQAFVNTSQASTYYKHIGNPLFVAKSTLYITQTLLGDGVIVWRCYVVFGKQWKAIVVPGTALLANAFAIAWRILVIDQFSKSFRTLLPVIIIVVETGALYSTALCGLLIAYLVGSNGQYPALDVVQPLVGIVFILIALQTHYHCGSASAPGNSQSTASIVPRYRWTPQGPRTAADDALYPMRSLAVQISEETTVDFVRSGGKKDEEEVSV